LPVSLTDFYETSSVSFAGAAFSAGAPAAVGLGGYFLDLEAYEGLPGFTYSVNPSLTKNNDWTISGVATDIPFTVRWATTAGMNSSVAPHFSGVISYGTSVSVNSGTAAVASGFAEVPYTMRTDLVPFQEGVDDTSFTAYRCRYTWSSVGVRGQKNNFNNICVDMTQASCHNYIATNYGITHPTYNGGACSQFSEGVCQAYAIQGTTAQGRREGGASHPDYLSGACFLMSDFDSTAPTNPTLSSVADVVARCEVVAAIAGLSANNCSYCDDFNRCTRDCATCTTCTGHGGTNGTATYTNASATEVEGFLAAITSYDVFTATTTSSSNSLSLPCVSSKVVTYSNLV
jgi:hypothetical protein